MGDSIYKGRNGASLHCENIKRTPGHAAAAATIKPTTQQCRTATRQRLFCRSGGLLRRPAPLFILDEAFRGAAKKNPMVWGFMQSLDQIDERTGNEGQREQVEERHWPRL
jgi:hypothetical protein